MGMMFTGPTMREFQVIDRTRREYCPEGSVVIADGDDVTDAGLASTMRKATELIYQEKNYPAAIRLLLTSSLRSIRTISAPCRAKGRGTRAIRAIQTGC